MTLRFRPPRTRRIPAGFGYDP